MKAKVFSLILCLSLVFTMLVSCIPAPPATSTPQATPTTAPVAKDTPAPEESITLKWALWDYDITPYWGALIDNYKAAKA